MEAQMAKLKAGDKAPDFALVDQHGKKVRLKDRRGRKTVVYVYPKANTSGCTTQSCALRDAEPDLAEIGADVIGISPDQPAAQLKFDEKYTLGFPLLSDADHAVADAWGTWGEKSLYGRKFMGIVRSAFVVDEKGKIAAVFYKVSPKDTVPKVTAALTT
jgi:peroxiredoxin Q/BCP